jgi:protein-S-isoprenylcysteine O-methyltransferase Ste14
VSPKAKATVGSLLFLVVAPGVMAGLVPWLVTGYESDASTVAQIAGSLLVLAGVAVLVHAFVRFVVEGLGTPAPVAPTRHLVVGGAYRYVRNPMYLAVGAAILGQALIFGDWALVVYAAAFLATTAAFARFYEEPALQRQFGAEYEQYTAAVRAWVPRLRPWSPSA